MRALAAVFCWALPVATAAAPLVAVDVGHYETEPGATSARGRPELEFNRALAAALAGALEERGLRVRVIGADGRMAVLSRRTAAARDARFFLSIHHDSVQPHYLEEWEHEGGRRRFSDRFAGFSLFVSRRNPELERSLACASSIGAALRAAGFARRCITPNRSRASRSRSPTGRTAFTTTTTWSCCTRPPRPRCCSKRA